MYTTGTDVTQVRKYFIRQPLPILRALKNNLRGEILDGSALASFTVLLDVISEKEAAR